MLIISNPLIVSNVNILTEVFNGQELRNYETERVILRPISRGRRNRKSDTETYREDDAAGLRLQLQIQKWYQCSVRFCNYTSQEIGCHN